MSPQNIVFILSAEKGKIGTVSFIILPKGACTGLLLFYAFRKISRGFSLPAFTAGITETISESRIVAAAISRI